MRGSFAQVLKSFGPLMSPGFIVMSKKFLVLNVLEMVQCSNKFEFNTSSVFMSLLIVN